MTSTLSKRLLEMAAGIVQTQASQSKMSPEEIESALTRTFNALQMMQKAEDEGRFLSSDKPSGETSEEKPLDPQASIQETKIICLECGAEMRQLTANHLAAHGLSPRQYKKKYGFPLRQPLSARALTRSRSKAAKKRGVPPELKAFQEERKRLKQSIEKASFGEEPMGTAIPLNELNVPEERIQEELQGKQEAGKPKKSQKKKVAGAA